MGSQILTLAESVYPQPSPEACHLKGVKELLKGGTRSSGVQTCFEIKIKNEGLTTTLQRHGKTWGSNMNICFNTQSPDITHVIASTT